MLPKRLSAAISVALVTQSFSNHTLAEDASEQVERVIVTGQKIDRTIQETAASVAVVTNEQIQQQNLIDFYDILDQAPNVNGRFGTDFSIRGIDAFSVSGGGNSYLTSIYVDGAILPFRMIQQGGFSAWDIDQVEILRGPQSTLQGRNALAGAIVMRTKTPTYDYNGKLRVTAGGDGKREAAIAFGGAIVEDQLAFRFSGEKNEFDGFNFNPTRNENSDFNDNETYRMKFLYEPKQVEGLTALFSYTHSKSDIGVPWVSSAGNPFAERLTTFNDPTVEFTDNDIFSLEVDYEIDDLYTFSSISTFVDSDYGYQWDGDVSPEPGSTLDDDRNDKTYTQELRLTFEGDNLDAIVGAFYSKLEVQDIYGGERISSFQQLGIPTLLVAPPEFGGLGLPPELANQVLALYAPADPVVLGTSGDLIQEVETMALYADFNYRLNDNWAIFGGIRYDREEQANEAVNLVTIDNADVLPDPTNPVFDPTTATLIAGLNAQLLGMAAAASGTEPLVDADFDAWLPKLGLSYFWNDDLSAHLTYQKGYRSGGVGRNVARNTTHVYNAEYTDNYEFSLRSVWLDGKLVANANFFYLDWTDQQVAVQLSGSRFDRETTNAGSSEVKGFELEFKYQPTSNLSLFAGLGQAKTEFKDFQIVLPTETFDLSGRTFGEAPEWTANIGANYEYENWFVNVNANYADSHNAVTNPYREGLRAGDLGFDPQNDGRTIVNARIGYQWGDMGLYFNAENLLDEEYITDANDNDGHITLGAPRLLSITFSADF